MAPFSHCKQQVRFTLAVMNMVGLPGTFKGVIIYAKPNAPTKALVQEDVEVDQGLGAPVIVNPNNPNWTCGLVDSNKGNNKFEAAIRYNYNATTTYFPGGDPGKSYPNANALLIGTFLGLGWFDKNTEKFEEFIQKYPPN